MTKTQALKTLELYTACAVARGIVTHDMTVLADSLCTEYKDMKYKATKRHMKRLTAAAQASAPR